MRRIFISLAVLSCGWPVFGQDGNFSDPATGSHGLWELIRPLEEGPTVVIQLSREAFDLVLRAPGAMVPWRLGPLLKDDIFQLGREHDAAAGESDGPAESWPFGIDAVLGSKLNLLGELITHSRWNVVRPAEAVDQPEAGVAATLQAKMSIPLGDAAPVEARLGIETDGVREDYFVFSTELASPQNPLAAKWLAWSTRLDYRSNVEAPASARAEQRVGFRLGKRDQVGVSGRVEDQEVGVGESFMVDLAPAGEVYWSHQWLPGLDSSLRVQQVLPDLQSIWLAGMSGNVQLEAAIRASLNSATKLDLRGTANPELTEYGFRFQLEFLFGVPR